MTLTLYPASSNTIVAFASLTFQLRSVMSFTSSLLAPDTISQDTYRFKNIPTTATDGATQDAGPTQRNSRAGSTERPFSTRSTRLDVPRTKSITHLHPTGDTESIDSAAQRSLARFLHRQRIPHHSRQSPHCITLADRYCGLRTHASR